MNRCKLFKYNKLCLYVAILKFPILKIKKKSCKNDNVIY